MEAGQLLPAANFVEQDDQLLIYYAWREDTHYLDFPGARRSYNVALLRVDGFAGIRADENKTGQWLTPVLSVPGEAQGLQVNAAVAGALQVEVLDAQGKPIAGFSLADSVAFSGDQTRAFMKWTVGRFHDLAGQDVQLRFHLTNGEIFSFSFSPVSSRGTEPLP